jgi:hypothetical protein
LLQLDMILLARSALAFAAQLFPKGR